MRFTDDLLARWLALHDRADEAKAVLMRLHDDGTASHHAAAAEEFHVMMHQINIERTLDSSWMNMLRTASLRKRALITLGVTGWIQCSGVLVINSTLCGDQMSRLLPH